MSAEHESEVRERLATIEANLAHMEKEADERTAELKQIDSKLDTLTKELSRYRGTVGGILLVFASLGTLFKLFGESVAEFFKGVQ